MMTPNLKEGIDYFPFDVNFLFELSTRRLMKKYGLELVYAYINLSAGIYHQKGYYAVCDEELLFITSELMFLDEETVAGLIEKCVEAGLFDHGMYENFGILTSEEIQRNYLFATKRRKKVSIKEEFRLIEQAGNKKVKVCKKKECNTMSTSCIHRVDKNEQSKIESKSKYRKRK